MLTEERGESEKKVPIFVVFSYSQVAQPTLDIVGVGMECRLL